jgi:predicted dinucleotide-binding enzyme
MKISVIGAGNIGRTLGKKWVEAEHKVIWGVRNPFSEKVQRLRSELPEGEIKTITESIQPSEIVLLATPYAAVKDIVQINASDLVEKIIIDSSNNFSSSRINNLATIQEAVPSASIYRAFNSLGWEIFENPKFQDFTADHFFAGPNGEERLLVEQLITDIGLHPIWVGGPENAYIVDALGSLWVTLVFQRGYKRSTALKLIKR